MNHKDDALWLLKRCTLYILCTLILRNSLHLTIGSSLTLIHNELWIPKCCHAHFKVLFPMFKVFKKCHQDFNLLHTYYTYYTSYFWMKSGSFIVCFHPITHEQENFTWSRRWKSLFSPGGQWASHLVHPKTSSSHRCKTWFEKENLNV
jgi:hypothetical protein